MTTRTLSKDRVSRAFATDLEIRSDGRTLVGIAVPFASPTTIYDAYGSYTELVVRGAFARTINERGPARVKFLANHDAQQFPIGKTISLREDAAGLIAEFRVAQTPRGDEALQLVREGALDGLSIGFRPIRDQWSSDGETRHILEAALHEISLVNAPAYADAVVTAVRNETTPLLAAARQQLFLKKEVPLYVIP